MKKKAVVLLSGGIDSATALFMARDRGYACYPLVFDYGQRHKKEIESAKKISGLAGCAARVLKIELPWKGSSILDKDKRLPRNRALKDIKKGIPSSYVPARNTIFLSFALSYAEAIGADKIFIGANSVDFSGYPDCRGPFLEAFGNVIREGTKAARENRRISLEAPLLFKTKAQIIKEGMRRNVPYEHTWSCYEGKGRPCGVCDSCVIRREGFRKAGIKDSLDGDGR